MRLVLQVDVPKNALVVNLMPKQHLFGVMGVYDRGRERLCRETEDVVGMGVRKEVQRGDGWEIFRGAELVNTDWKGWDKSMKRRSSRHDKLLVVKCSFTEEVAT